MGMISTGIPFTGMQPAFGARRPTAGKSPAKPGPEIMRLVLTGAPKPDSAPQILLDAFARWPKNTRSRYFITPGGFAEAEWPQNWRGKSGWQATSDEDLAPLLASAEKKLKTIVTPAVLKAAKNKTDYLTIGLDVVGDKGLKGPHAELVAVVDVTRKKIAGWTGKSYPTAAQNQKLVPVTDLGSHFMNLDGDRVMILGCNDLNMFSPRVHANQKPGSERARRCDEMVMRAEAFDPTVILQHPHATDTPNIWRMAWMAIDRAFPNATSWASAIRYFNPRGETRRPMEKVLGQTRSDDERVQDLVIDTAPYVSQPSRYMQGFQSF